MKNLLAAGACIAAAISGTSADLCAKGSTEDNGNWYCQEVTGITYTGVGGTGSYNKVTNMDSASSSCSSKAFGYSGSMSPLDEEVSLHFRGPVNLKQFAVYTPGSASSKAKYRRSASSRHGHALSHVQAHAHKETRTVDEEVEKRQVGATVVATIDGQVVSWINEWTGESTTSAATAAVSVAAATTTAPTPSSALSPSSSAAATSSSIKTAIDRTTSSSGSWSQRGYYNAESGSASGLTFLNHMGGQGSGVFDYTFGNSLSYASADGCSGASSPQVLTDTILPSDTEIVIMSDVECTDGDCGYVRPGTVAYHGFDGAQKAFFFEFEMPHDTANTNIATAGDMPAIWMLNAQIPLTLQYGQADCSCWVSGCGEFDIFEILAPGDTRCKSTLHGNINGGDSDYFARPTSGTVKAAMVLNNDNIHIKILDDSFDFGSSISAAAINEICTSTATQTSAVSLFALAQ